MTTQAVTLASWANDGYEINRETGECRLTDDDRKNCFLESLKLFKAAIECGPDSYSGGWGGLGHVCEMLRTARLLRFRKCRHLLPEQIQQATGWGDAASKVFGIEKGRNPKETARIQTGLKQPLPLESFSAADKRPVTTKRGDSSHKK